MCIPNNHKWQTKAAEVVLWYYVLLHYFSKCIWVEYKCRLLLCTIANHNTMVKSWARSVLIPYLTSWILYLKTFSTNEHRVRANILIMTLFQMHESIVKRGCVAFYSRLSYVNGLYHLNAGNSYKIYSCKQHWNTFQSILIKFNVHSATNPPPPPPPPDDIGEVCFIHFVSHRIYMISTADPANSFLLLRFFPWWIKIMRWYRIVFITGASFTDVVNLIIDYRKVIISHSFLWHVFTHPWPNFKLRLDHG